jgi:2-polyprenyl-6-methoxyphenol hydroxylase-like FAD-dependent oxidoreductase
MPSVDNVLVVGGGLAGAAAGTLLAEGGVAVDLIEARPDVTALGSGIALQGNALCVLRQPGVFDELQASGYAFNTVGLRAPDADGTLLVELRDIRSGGLDLPASLGIDRRVLARILMDRARGAGVKLRLGTTTEVLRQDGSGVEVRLSDGTSGRYDLVIGADGVRSATREAVGIELTRPAGMGIWRALVPRPAPVTRVDVYYGGPCYIAGYCPTSQSRAYAYLVEDPRAGRTLGHGEQLALMRQLASAYHGPWDTIRGSLTGATPGQLHIVRGAPARAAMAPRPGGADR